MRALPTVRLLLAAALTLATLGVLAQPTHAQTGAASLPTYGPTSCVPSDPELVPSATDAPVLPFARLWTSLRASVQPALATISRWDPRAALDAATRRPVADRTRVARTGSR